MIKAVIFDLDGTLADTICDITDSLNEMLESMGFPTHTVKQVKTFINHSARQLVSGALPEAVRTDDFIVDSALEIYSECYKKKYLDKTKAYDGIKETLERLKTLDGLLLCVLSNKPEGFSKNIIEKLFGEELIRGDDVHGHSEYPPKPDPTYALKIAEELKVTPSECVFVGDSDVDIKTAYNAGMPGIAVCWGYRSEDFLLKNGAKYIIRTPDELPDKIYKITMDSQNSEKKRY